MMLTTKTLLMLGAVTVALASASGCKPPPPPPVTPATAPQARLSAFLDPEVEVALVQDEKGRVILAPFHDALAAALTDAGYHVVDAAGTPHDLTFHARVARVGFNYGAWADGVTLAVQASGQEVAHASRPSVNFVHIEGADTAARLTFAAHVLVNAVDGSPDLTSYAETHIPAASTPPAGTSPPAYTAQPAPPPPPAYTAQPAAAPPPAAEAPKTP